MLDDKEEADIFKDCLPEIERHAAAAHAMQSGVAFEMGQAERRGKIESSVTPKSLRVGVNTALCDSGALARLLIVKGLITAKEYTGAIAVEMENEKGRYEERIRKDLGKDEVTLG